MKVGDNIKEIREIEKNYKRSYMAEKLNISTRAYINIENNIAEITLGRLEQISNILECTPTYILNYKENKTEFYNHFHNNYGNQGVIQINQAEQNKKDKTIENLLYELLQSEKDRIALLESILRKNNIAFN